MRALLGVLLLGVQASFVIPMVLQVPRARSANGVSLTGEALWTVAGVGWAVYAYATGDLAIVASGTLAALGSGALSVLAGRHASRASRRRAVGAAAGSAVGGVTAGVLGGVVGLAWALSVFGVVQFLPHLATAAALWLRREPAEGLSVPGTALRAVYAAGWSLYAAGWAVWGITGGAIQWPLLAWGLVGALAFSAQGAVAVRTRRLSVAAQAA